MASAPFPNPKPEAMMDEACKSQPQDKIIDIWCDPITLGVEKVNHQLLSSLVHVCPKENQEHKKTW